MTEKEAIRRAAEILRKAKGLLITAGAGMGVDSGLPDFRGPQGFWKAYPPLKSRGLQLPGMSTPKWFFEDPNFAWGFFGHRYNLYSSTTPHQGFQILKKWAFNMPYDYFVFTSNVDGHFQKAGFDEDKIVECHGSINFLQCIVGSTKIWPVEEDTQYDVDSSTLTLKSALPEGPPHEEHQVLARPNILMFNDGYWVETRTANQERQFSDFLISLSVKQEPYAIIEIGAGTYVPTVRHQSERLISRRSAGSLIRINPLEEKVPAGNHIGIKLPALEALEAIERELSN